MNDRPRRLFGGQTFQKTGQVRLGTFYLDKDSARIVDDPAGKGVFGGQPVNKGAEADPLDGPVQHEADPLPPGAMDFPFGVGTSEEGKA